MEYVCVKSRFHFFDGRRNYTVQYNYAISMWYVFKDETDSDALWSKKIVPSKNKTPNRIEAEFILDQYLDTLVPPKNAISEPENV